MRRRIIKYGSMIIAASLGLWSGSTAALHFEDQRNLSPTKIELVKIELPVFVASIKKEGEKTTLVRANYSVSIPSKSQANPALTDMLSDALLRATIKTFSNPSREEIKIPHIAANRIANLSNSFLNDVSIEELHITELAVFKYIR